MELLQRMQCQHFWFSRSIAAHTWLSVCVGILVSVPIVHKWLSCHSISVFALAFAFAPFLCSGHLADLHRRWIIVSCRLFLSHDRIQRVLIEFDVLPQWRNMSQCRAFDVCDHRWVCLTVRVVAKQLDRAWVVSVSWAIIELMTAMHVSSRSCQRISLCRDGTFVSCHCRRICPIESPWLPLNTQQVKEAAPTMSRKETVEKSDGTQRLVKT